MNTLRILGLVLFVLGAILAILDLLDIVTFRQFGNPFYIALGLMIIGITMTFKAQVQEQKMQE